VRESGIKYYPSVLQAIHLVVLYIFIQTVVDFPLAIIDYYEGTEYLYNPWKKIILGVGSVLFILYYGFRKAKNKLSEVFPLRFFNPLILFPVITFLWGAHIYLNEVNNWIDKIIPPPSWFWELFNGIFESDYGWIGAFMKVVIIAPVVEELIFRGVIMHGLMRNYPKLRAVFYSALLFALFHLNPWQFPGTFVLGLLLGWLMIRTRNIFLCILGHAINNFLVLLSITYYQEISASALMQMEKKYLFLIAGLVAVCSLILIYLLSLKKKTPKPEKQE